MSTASPQPRGNKNKGKKHNNGNANSPTAPTFKGAAATVNPSQAPPSPSTSPFYVTSIKSASKKKTATSSSSSSIKTQSSSSAAKAVSTVSTSHAKAAKGALFYDKTRLGLLDPAYILRVAREGFISAPGWEHLRTGYRYTGVDHSFCGNRFLYLWWNFVVDRLVPLWVAPNLLTLLGFMCNFGAYLLSAYSTENMTGAAPSYVWAILGFSIFAYQTLDSIDGRQARRTNTASPLGELFDHVCDSAICILFVLNVACMTQLGPVWAWILCWAILTPFYFCHWEEYYTGVLEMGQFNGPVEAQLFAMFVCFGTAIATSIDPQFWVREAVFGLTRNHCLILLFLSMVGPTVMTHMWTVTKSRRNRGGMDKATAQLFPLAWLFVTGTTWMLTAKPVYMAHPHTFLLAFGSAFAYITSRLIVQRMCHEPIRPFYTILVLPTFGALNSLVPYLTSRFIPPLIDEERLVAFFFVYATGSFLFLCYSLTHQLCRLLKIRAFTIPHPPLTSKLQAARPSGASSRPTSL